MTKKGTSTPVKGNGGSHIKGNPNPTCAIVFELTAKKMIVGIKKNSTFFNGLFMPLPLDLFKLSTCIPFKHHFR